MPPKRQKPLGSTSRPATTISNVKEAAHQSSTNPSLPPTFTIPSPTKPILCQLFPSPNPSASNKNKTSTIPPSALIFTHGASGGITNAATLLFAQGYSQQQSSSTSSSSVLLFEGPTNLSSRVKQFHTILDHRSGHDENADPLILGGRSMGARAAVISMTERLTSTSPTPTPPTPRGLLILASYPLVSPANDVRDAILLALPSGVSVLFISGDKDSMCPLPRLNEVRAKMHAKSWLITIRGADHGVSLTPKDAVEKVREYIGTAAAKWVRGEGREVKEEGGKTECVVRWDGHAKRAVDEGWKEGASAGLSGFVTSAKKKKDNDVDEAEAEAEEKAPPSKRRKKA